MHRIVLLLCAVLPLCPAAASAASPADFRTGVQIDVQVDGPANAPDAAGRLRFPAEQAGQTEDADVRERTPLRAEWPGAPCINDSDCGALKCCRKVCAASCRDAVPAGSPSAPRCDR